MTLMKAMPFAVETSCHEHANHSLFYSIETWALEEAKRRLQAEGTLPEDA